MKYAIIKDSIVINIVEWNDNTETWSPPEGCTAVIGSIILPPDHEGGRDIKNEARIGDTYDGVKFVSPSE